MTRNVAIELKKEDESSRALQFIIGEKYVNIYIDGVWAADIQLSERKDKPPTLIVFAPLGTDRDSNEIKHHYIPLFPFKDGNKAFDDLKQRRDTDFHNFN